MPPAVTAGSMPGVGASGLLVDAEGGGDGGAGDVGVQNGHLAAPRAMATAREAVTVLLPTPPLPLTTAMTRVMQDLALAGTRMSREEQSALQLEQSWVQFQTFSGVSFLPRIQGGANHEYFKTAGRL